MEEDNTENIKLMKVSIITTTYNTRRTVGDTIKSVVSQTYPNIEYIVIDDESTDDTLDVVKKYSDKITKIVAAPHSGIFGALNVGVKLATGDIVAILNSDDFYASNDVIETVVNRFEESSADCVWGDMVVVDKDDVKKVIRNWKSRAYKEGAYQRGWHPPHPSFFVKRWAYEKFGLFRTDLWTSADYELVLRFVEKYKISSSYIPKVLTVMRNGGSSSKSLFNWIRGNVGAYRAFKLNGLKISPFFIFRKPLGKLGQFLSIPRKHHSSCF
ncbi:MAG: glycosyltransferase family 2 protein [Candidatus Taylorbacteria bacterium]